MKNRFSLFAFPAACAALMIGMAACGGSGGGSTPTTPSIAETVAAVEQATTPAQGAFAYEQVVANIGASQDPVYMRISESDRAKLAQTFGLAIARENVSPSDSTYADAIAASEAEFGVDIDDAAVIGQLNTDLVNPPASFSDIGEKGLRLLRALEGDGVGLNEHVTPAAGLLFAQWFAERYSTNADAATRSRCTDMCSAGLQRDLKTIDKLLAAERAEIERQKEAGELTADEAKVAEIILEEEIEEGRRAALKDYDNCLKECHEQA